MPRRLDNSVHKPLATAIFIDKIDAYATNAPTDTNFQRQLNQSLSRIDPNRTISKRLIENFNAIPDEFKVPVFGSYKPGDLRKLSEAKIDQALLPSVTALFDDVGDAPPFEFPGDTQFTLTYTGLFCKKRTGDSGPIFTTSDEPYVITVAVTDENGQNVPRKEIHPVGFTKPEYSDVDTGEWRRGPFATCWMGRERLISLITTVMESDSGRAQDFADEIGLLVEAAASYAESKGISISEAIKDHATGLINTLIGTDDTLVGTNTKIISPTNLKEYAMWDSRLFKDTHTEVKSTGLFNFKVIEVPDQTDLEYDFFTRHKKDGSYAVTFQVTADKEPSQRTPRPSDDAEDGVFVLGNNGN